MSEATLTNLLEYLYDTLTPSNMRWMAMHLMAHADADEENLKPYTMEELNAMLDQAERDFAAGLGIPDEEVWRKYDKELKMEETLQLEMA